jgi:hypothetical protein
MKKILVVHGVGGTTPGVVAGSVASCLGVLKGEVRRVWSDGREFVEITDQSAQRSVLEINWSDINPAAQSVGILTYLLHIVTSMLDVAAGSHRWFAKIYRAMVVTVTPGAALFVLASAASYVVDDTNLRRLSLILLTIGLAGLTLYLRRFGSHFLLLWPWVAAIAIVTAASFSHTLQLVTTWHGLTKDSSLVEAAKIARMLGFVGVMTALDAAALESLIVSFGRPLPVKLANLALLYTPYVVMNGIMTWLTFLGFAWFARFPNHLTLERKSTPEGLAQFELAATVVITFLGLFALLAPTVLYVLGLRSHAPNVNRRGRGAQDGFLCFIAVAPICLLALELLMFWIYKHPNSPALTTWLHASPSSSDILTVYGRSVLRTIPFLGWLAGPFSVALRLIGDVLFYVQPNVTHPAAIGDECRKRLRAALLYATRDPHDSVLIIAHSQGSVIAADLRLRGEFRCPLLTLGSPLRSLYDRFLGLDFLGKQADIACWVNAYRAGDYIGGPLACSAANDKLLIESGGHTNYWNDPVLLSLVKEVESTHAPGTALGALLTN